MVHGVGPRLAYPWLSNANRVPHQIALDLEPYLLSRIECGMAHDDLERERRGLERTALGREGDSRFSA
jgi:hypothetical protein